MIIDDDDDKDLAFIVHVENNLENSYAFDDGNDYNSNLVTRTSQSILPELEM